MNKLKTLSGAQLKYIAFTTMLIDHVNKALIYPNLNGGILLVISEKFHMTCLQRHPILSQMETILCSHWLWYSLSFGS